MEFDDFKLVSGVKKNNLVLIGRQFLLSIHTFKNERYEKVGFFFMVPWFHEKGKNTTWVFLAWVIRFYNAIFSKSKK